MYNWNIFLLNQNVSRVCSSYPKILNNHITICIWATTTTKRNETCKNLLLPYCYSTHYFFIIKNIRMFGLQISGKFQTRTIVKVNTSKWKRMHLIISFKWYSCIILRLMFVLHGVVPKRLVLVNGQCFYSKITSIRLLAEKGTETVSIFLHTLNKIPIYVNILAQSSSCQPLRNKTYILTLIYHSIFLQNKELTLNYLSNNCRWIGHQSK